ncbi:hypothetical protein [Desulfosporosinus lacus]|uniref:Uncharacterized protein n=1 Tax=Desulfosporosinus lacus DSM 15449 TaxID=1121420 RepID=A0A1M5ZN21_9FIRM|nr:hypothetical protein [Desulfosporosinus lacus]SHI25581.1 hypothetical protein SAMN02746098_03443 [Desulfosporosinus lacus DSM 15449]
MTHSLHRRGTDEYLKNDFTLLVTAASGINHIGSREGMSKILDAVWEIGPTNIGSNETGTTLSGVTLEQIRSRFTKVPRIRCNFASKEKAFAAIKKMQELDTGMSVTLSGPIEHTLNMCKEYGIKPHSINLSLDVWGKKDKLPAEEVLELMTMCGHGLVSRTLIEETMDKVKQGKISAQQATVIISPLCICGIYNTERAEKLFEKCVPNK